MLGAKVVMKREVRVSCPVALCFCTLRRYTRPRGTWKGLRLPGTLRRTKEGSGNGASLCMEALRGAPGWGLLY